MLANPSSLIAFVATATAATASMVVDCLLLIACKGCGLKLVIATSLIVELVDDRVKCKNAIREKVSSDCTSVCRVGIFDRENKLAQHPLPGTLSFISVNRLREERYLSVNLRVLG